MSLWAAIIGAAVGIANGAQQQQNAEQARQDANAQAYATANENSMAMILEQMNAGMAEDEGYYQSMAS